MIGYKIFEPDWTCLGYQYSCPGEFLMDEHPVICKTGFHFSPSIVEALEYKPFRPGAHIAKVEALGELVSDKTEHKYATNHLKVIEEISFFDYWQEQLDSRHIKTLDFTTLKEDETFTIGNIEFTITKVTEGYVDIQPTHIMFYSDMMADDGQRYPYEMTRREDETLYDRSDIAKWLRKNRTELLPMVKVEDIFIPSLEYFNIKLYNYYEKLKRYTPTGKIEFGYEGRCAWWLSTVVSSVDFALVGTIGLADYYSASYAIGVVPIFRIKRTKNKVKKPPLGLMPKDIWEYESKQDRFTEVRGAIYRYLNDGKSLNLDWINEYNELSKYLEMYNKEIVGTCAIPITEEDLNQ